MGFALSGRFKLLDAPYASPGKCAVCGYSASGDSEPDDRRQYLDFGLDIEYYGAIYICTACVNEVAVGMGYALPEIVDAVREEAEQVKSELARLSAATEVINELGSVLTRNGWLPAGSDSDSVIGEATVTEITSAKGSGNPEAVKPVDEPRPDDLRDALSLG